MAFRELHMHMVEIKECLRLWAQGKGYRIIAKQTGLVRSTVKRHVTAPVAATWRWPSTTRFSPPWSANSSPVGPFE